MIKLYSKINCGLGSNVKLLTDYMYTKGMQQYDGVKRPASFSVIAGLKITMVKTTHNYTIEHFCNSTGLMKYGEYRVKIGVKK